jgi:predicted anti-sigma-YlaC factor YlaD
MRCSSCEPMLDDHLEATLSRRQMREVALHLRSCPACNALFEELRVIDALLTTAQSRGRIGSDFTAAVISAAAAAAPPHPRKRVALWVPLLAYLCVAWALLAFAALDARGVAGLLQRFAAWGERGFAAIEAGLRAVAPETGVAAAAVSGVLLVDLLLLAAIFYGYRRLRLILSVHLARGSRS